MTKHEQIKEDIKTAMKAKEETRLNVLRGVLTSITNELVASKRKPDEILEDDKVLAVIGKLAKQRKDSIKQFRDGAREDLAAIEESELAILDTFLPTLMTQEEIEPLAVEQKEKLGISDMSDSGKLMGAIMKELKGKADGTDVKVVVERLLS